jgi:hypothetical protein
MSSSSTHYTIGAHIEQALDELIPQKAEEEKKLIH